MIALARIIMNSGPRSGKRYLAKTNPPRLEVSMIDAVEPIAISSELKM